MDGAGNLARRSVRAAFLDVIADYLRDAESRNFATLLEWLNPQYAGSLSLHASKPHVEFAEIGKELPPEALRDDRRPRRVRAAAMQYLLRPIDCHLRWVSTPR